MKNKTKGQTKAFSKMRESEGTSKPVIYYFDFGGDWWCVSRWQGALICECGDTPKEAFDFWEITVGELGPPPPPPKRTLAEDVHPRWCRLWGSKNGA